MLNSEFHSTCVILEASRNWSEETLQRCPKMFLIIRAVYLESREPGEISRHEARSRKEDVSLGKITSQTQDVAGQ